MLVKGGLLGDGDSSYLAMILLQMLIIISLSRVLVWLLAKIGQPSIVGQILCGVILGPSVMGHIPGFTNLFFPEDSIDNLYMISDFTLVLYVFLVGLELNPSNVFQKKRKYPFYIGFTSVFFPFFIGLGMSFILKDENLIHGTKNTITHTLYFGLVLSVSALPVSSRIISELGLLQTVVGASSVSIIAVDNILCWGLLIVISSFINSTNDTLSPLYIFLSLMAATLFMVFVLKPLINLWLKHYQNDLEHEGAISEFIVSFIFILLLLSSWTTHRFGGHAVIGSFLLGLILPHGPFTVKMTEKVEDVVVIFLLPMYVAASGLRSNFDFTSDYMFWIWLVLFFAASSLGKIIPAAVVAKLCKYSWRESFSIGILLNTKGLMDLVVLNMGYDTLMLTDKTYTLFILITILTTFSTTLLISKVYSPRYRVPMALDAPMDVEFNDVVEMSDDNDHSSTDQSNQPSHYKLLITVTNTKSLPGLMTLLHLLNSKIINRNNSKTYNQPKLMVHTLRVMEFSERSSSIQMATDATTTTNLDPISSIIRTFGQLNNINIIANLIIAKPSDFASTISYYADNFHSNLLIIPYDIAESNYIGAPQSGYLTLANIFENPNEQSSNPSQIQQVNNYTVQKTLRSVKSEYLPGIIQFLRNSNCPVGIYVDRGFGQGPAMMLNSLGNSNSEMTYANTVTNLSNINLFAQTVMIIFIGGPDDREALNLVTRIAKNNRVHVIIKRIRQSNEIKSPIVETTINEEYPNNGLTFQPTAIKSTSLQTYQKILSNLSEHNNNSNRSSIVSIQDRKNSSHSRNEKTVEIIDLSDCKINDNNNSNNNIKTNIINEKIEEENNESNNNLRKNSDDSLSSKPSIADSISSSEKSLKIDTPNDVLNTNKETVINNDNEKLPSINGMSTPSKTNSPIINEMTPFSIDSRTTSISQNQSTSVSKSSSIKKRGTLLGKYIKNKKNSLEERFNMHHSITSLKKVENDDENNNNNNNNNNNTDNEGENKSIESFSIEVEVDTYEDSSAFSEIKKLLNKNNSHISIEDVTLNSSDQLNDICVDLVHSIGKKDLLIIGRENILPELNNNIVNNDTDIANAKQQSNDIKSKNETGNEYNNSYDPNDNTDNNIQKTVSSFVTSHFYGGNTNAGSNNLQEEARLRTMAGSLGYRVIKECSASVMIVQASKYKGYERTMDDINEMEEEKPAIRRRFSLTNRKESLRKMSSFKDHGKISTDSIDQKSIFKRRSSSIRNSFRNENLNAVTIKSLEDKQQSVNINISEIAKELSDNRIININENEEQQSIKSPNTNRIVFDVDDARRNSNYSNTSKNKNEINIMNSNSFSRNNTLSSKEELERERIKKIIKERESLINNEIHQDIADSNDLYLDSSSDELDNNSDTGL